MALFSQRVSGLNKGTNMEFEDLEVILTQLLLLTDLAYRNDSPELMKTLNSATCAIISSLLRYSDCLPPMVLVPYFKIVRRYADTIIGDDGTLQSCLNIIGGRNGLQSRHSTIQTISAMLLQLICHRLVTASVAPEIPVTILNGIIIPLLNVSRGFTTMSDRDMSRISSILYESAGLLIGDVSCSEENTQLTLLNEVCKGLLNSLFAADKSLVVTSISADWLQEVMTSLSSLVSGYNMAAMSRCNVNTPRLSPSDHCNTDDFHPSYMIETYEHINGGGVASWFANINDIIVQILERIPPATSGIASIAYADLIHELTRCKLHM